MSLIRFSTRYPALFDHFVYNDSSDWSNLNFLKTNTTLPSVNIKESDEDFEFEIAAPGLSKEDFRLELNNDLLTISSERENNNEMKEGEQFTKREFSYSSFTRSFTLPDTADGEKIEARYENGILRLLIPKKEEAKPKPVRQIAIA
jgi:HSP20 family protein